VTLLSNILTAEDVDAADRLATLMERSGLSLFEAQVDGLTIGIIRADAARVAGDDAAPAEVIAAPRVGIFRTAGVDVGQSVMIGAVIGRIKVLGKLYDVVATQAGTVHTLCAEDGDFVEYGQPLLTIRRSAAAD
jgi:biotin carboxyl carrier protein